MGIFVRSLAQTGPNGILHDVMANSLESASLQLFLCQRVVVSLLLVLGRLKRLGGMLP